jgi:hypothetical protein
MKKKQALFFSECSEEINVLKYPNAVWQSFLSISPHHSGGTMATSQRCCHLSGKMSNSAAECAGQTNKQTNRLYSLINIDMLRFVVIRPCCRRRLPFPRQPRASRLTQSSPEWTMSAATWRPSRTGRKGRPGINCHLIEIQGAQ